MTDKHNWLKRVNNNYAKNGLGKFTDNQIRTIRQSMLSREELMKKYDIRRTLIIDQILNYETYQDVF